MGKLSGSLKRDILPNDMLPNDWRDARNIVLNKKIGCVSIEDGVQELNYLGYPTSKMLIGSTYIDGNKILLFGTNGAAISGEIGIIRSNGVYEPIFKDSASKIVLNFNSNPTQVVAEKKFNDNIIIAFKDSENVPKILNLDCLPFQIETDYTVKTADLIKAKALIKLFPDYKVPIVEAYNLEVLEGQGALPTGAYYPAFAYEGFDGSVTPWSKIYNGIPIFSSNTGADSATIEGGEPGDPTTKAIKITLSNIDNNYRKIKVGYIYVSNGITTAYQENSFPIDRITTTVTVLLTGSNTLQLNLDEVLVPPAIYEEVQTLTSLQKSLYLADLKTPEDFNFQTYANQITLNWVRDKSVKINGTVRDGNSTFQDPKKTFFDKSFKSGEAYAFYITLNYINGTSSKAFHIPGRAASGTDKNVLNPGLFNEYDALDNSEDVYRYQILNTHGVLTQTQGDLGFWENENEEYPVDPSNPTTAVHPDFANISGISFANRKVRHHVFPDLTYLEGGGVTEKFVTGTLATYPVDDMESKVFGIRVAGVNIPAAIQPYVVSWEIHYAERNNSNIRVIASDVASKIDNVGGNDLLWFQPFDLMTSRASLMPTYIKPLMEFNTSGATAGEYDNFVEDLSFIVPGGSLAYTYNIINVEEALYLGQEVTIPYDNTGLADAFLVITPNVTTPTVTIPSAGASVVLLHDLCIFKRDMYLGFQSQTLVSTGYSFAVTASGVQTTRNVYGGDVYINRHSVLTTSTGTQCLSYVCESAANIGLRKEDLAQAKFFAPKSSTPSPSWYGYETDFNCINKFNQLDVYYPSEVCLAEDATEHRNRVAYSASEGTENSSLNWRIFKINSYYDSVNDKGEIWNIEAQDRILYIHHKHSLFIAEVKDTINTVGSEIALKVGGIFDRPAREVFPTKGGYAGTQNKFACLLCPLGYCFVDKLAKKIFIYGTNGLREISAEGLSEFFFDSIPTKYDEFFGDLHSSDNPFSGEGYCMGYDQRYNRLLITKRATNFGSGKFEFTVSYSPDANEGKGGWVSFHDYLPSAYITDRENLYAIQNNIPGTTKIFRHNYETFKAKYYDAVIKKSYIDLVSNEISTISKEFESISWISNSEQNKINYPDETFTHLMTYNDSQCSGELSLQADASAVWYSKNAKNVIGTWNFNKFRDMINNSAAAFLDENNALITGNISSNKPWYKRSKFISKYLIFRLITDNIIQKDLHLSSFNVIFKKSER